MTWTTDIPTKPGWYWMRRAPGMEEPVEIYIGPNPHGMKGKRRPMTTRRVREIYSLSCLPVDDDLYKDCEWAGPIEPPPEDERETNP